MRRILYISAIGCDSYDREIAAYLQSAAAGSLVEATSLKNAPLHLEYLYYGALVGPGLLHRIKRAEREGYDAAVIGCFYDPFLEEAREICERLVIAAPAESSMAIAATLGSSFSIIAGRRKVVPKMMENVRRYGHSERLASFRTVDMGVLDFQTKKALSEERILEEARRAVDEDGAEVVILGCTKEFGFYRKIQDALGVPVIDSMLAAFKQAEYLAELRCRLGWAPSKVGAYETPPVEEIAEWGLDAASDMKGLWRAGDTSRPGG